MRDVDVPRVAVAVAAGTDVRGASLADVAALAWFTGWESHIYPGLRLAGIPLETRSALARALGEVGTEAEYVLHTCAGLSAARALTPTDGKQFLARLEASCLRLIRTAVSLEVATQSYLAAMAASGAVGTAGVAGADGGEEWWYEGESVPLPAEAFELRLRRCGFAYRHIVQLEIVTHLDAVLERLYTFLGALVRLPPAGVLSRADLCAGLYTLSAMIQGDVIVHHIDDLNRNYPGLLTGIARLRQLAAAEDTSLESDLAWAYAQRAYVLNQAHSLERSALRVPEHERAPLHAQVLAAVAEWEAIIHELARLNRPAGTRL